MHPHTRQALFAGILFWGTAIGAIFHLGSGHTCCGLPSEARVEIGILKQAVDSFWIIRQEYPDSLSQLSDPPAGMNPIMERLPEDPWGNEYVYVAAHGTLVLYSMGRDGRDGTGDEVCQVALFTPGGERSEWSDLNCHCSRTDLCTAQ
jgi:hypothetical protein